MRTRILCGWLVGHADAHRTLWRNAEFVFEGNTVLFVGARFDGAVDREIDAPDKLVAPWSLGTDTCPRDMIVQMLTAVAPMRASCARS
jgi:5-methylthioadenosine/S-adenosylhomocysteine deaminase